MAYAESRTANQKPGNLKFCAPFNEQTLIGLNLIWDIQKEGERVHYAEIKSVHSGYLDKAIGIY